MSDESPRAPVWKCGNEFVPFHPQASHVRPDYRDGWNACFAEAQRQIDKLTEELQEKELLNARLRTMVAELAHALQLAGERLNDEEQAEDDSDVLTLVYQRGRADERAASRVEIARVPAQRAVSRDEIREVFLAHGFTVKPGNDDLKDYVYEAAEALLTLAAAADPDERAESHGENPLTEDRVFEAWGKETHGGETPSETFEAGVRYAEREHGIPRRPT